MTSKRTYGQACAVAHALDVVGDRWALLVVRDLRLGPKRFSDLAAGLPGIGPTVLTQRLRDLVEEGVVAKRTLPPPAASAVYELTEWGRGLEPVFRALAGWGMRGPTRPVGSLSTDSVVLGLRTFFRPAGPPWTATVALRIGRDTFTARVVDGELASLERGEAGTPDAALIGTVEELHATVTGTGAEELTIEGDPATAQRFLASIAIPR